MEPREESCPVHLKKKVRQTEKCIEIDKKMIMPKKRFVERTEAKTIDDSSGESVQPAIDNVGNKAEYKEEPCFGIQNRFNHLVTFEVPVDHTRLVLLNPGDGGESFFVIEEPSSNG